MNENQNGQRIDQWLWHARFFKSRTLAQKMVESGKVRVNQEKVLNSGKRVFPDMVLTITLHRSIQVVEIRQLASNRGPYSEARKLYRKLADY